MPKIIHIELLVTHYSVFKDNPIYYIDPFGNIPVKKGDDDDKSGKEKIADAITAIAEKGHELYLKLESYTENHPWLIDAANKTIRPLKKAAKASLPSDVNQLDWIDLMNIWLFEIGTFEDDKMIFGPDAWTTKDLQNQEGVIEARKEAIDQINKGNLDPIKKVWKYGQKEFYDGFEQKNGATSFIGSYKTEIQIVKNPNGTYTLNYKIHNSTTWESGTRLRKDNDGNGSHDEIIPSKSRGEGIKLGGNLNQVYYWSETIIN